MEGKRFGKVVVSSSVGSGYLLIEIICGGQYENWGSDILLSELVDDLGTVEFMHHPIENNGVALIF